MGLGTGTWVTIVFTGESEWVYRAVWQIGELFSLASHAVVCFFGTTMSDSRILLLLVAIALSVSARGNKNIIKKLKDLAFDEKVEDARSLVESERENRPADDPELLAALSWVARGACFAENWKTAQACAQETYKRSSKVAKKNDVDASPMLATALGASIESGIQKNYLLASLEGQPMPVLNPDRYVGESPPVDVQGKVVVYYFWAHWCGSSRRQKPALI